MKISIELIGQHFAAYVPSFQKIAVIFFAIFTTQCNSMDYRRSELIRDLNQQNGSKFFNKEDDSDNVVIDGESFDKRKFRAVVEAYLNCSEAIKPIKESITNDPTGQQKISQPKQERFKKHCFDLIDPESFTLRSNYLNPAILSYWNANLFNELNVRGEYQEIILSMKNAVQIQEAKKKELESQKKAEQEVQARNNKEKIAASEKRRQEEQAKADKEEAVVKARAKNLAEKTMQKEKLILFGSARMCRTDRKITILSVEYDRAVPCFNMNERQISETKIHVFQVLYECTIPGSEAKLRPEVPIPFALTKTGLATFRHELQNANPSPFCN